MGQRYMFGSQLTKIKSHSLWNMSYCRRYGRPNFCFTVTLKTSSGPKRFYFLLIPQQGAAAAVGTSNTNIFGIKYLWLSRTRCIFSHVTVSALGTTMSVQHFGPDWNVTDFCEVLFWHSFSLWGLFLQFHLNPVARINVGTVWLCKAQLC